MDNDKIFVQAFSGYLNTAKVKNVRKDKGEDNYDATEKTKDNF